MPEILSANTILYCCNWQATRHFYAEILQLDIRFSREDWFIEFRTSAQSCISIADITRCSIEAAPGKVLTLSFQIEHLLKLHDSLEAQGVPVTAIRRNSWRAPYFFARDPEDNRIEFWSEQA